jgi:hypothetical protein
MHKAYKVIKVTSYGQLVSVSPIEGWILKYKENVWTERLPGTVGIFVFRELPAARKFVRIFGDIATQMFVVQTDTPCIEITYKYLDVALKRTRYYRYAVKKILQIFGERDRRNCNPNFLLQSYPFGTCVVNKVKLLRKVN